MSERTVQSAAARGERWHAARCRAKIFLRGVVRWGVRAAILGVLLAAGVFAYLHVVGVPAALTDVFLERMAREGLFLKLDRLSLELDRGLVARNVRVFADEMEPVPLLEAGELTATANPLDVWRRRAVTPVISVVDGVLRVSLGQEEAGEARHGVREVAIENIHLRASARGEELRLRDFSAEFFGIQFRGRGAVYLPPEGTADVERDDDGDGGEAGAGRARVLLEALRQVPEGAVRVVEQLNHLSFREMPVADFTFAVYLAHPEANMASLRFNSPAGVRAGGVEFDRCLAEVTWKEGRLEFPDVQVHKGAGMAGLSGWYNTGGEQELSVHVRNTLTPDVYLSLCPAEWRERVAEVAGDARFPLRVEAQVGPAPARRAAEKIKARVTLSGAEIRGMELERLEATVERDGPEIRLERAEIQLGKGPGASRLRLGGGSFRLDTHRFEVVAEGGINPHHFKTLLKPNMRTIVEWFGLTEPAEVSLVLGGMVGDPAMYCYGPVSGTNFTIRGQTVQSLKARLNITNEVMHLTGVTGTRPEGTVRGEAHMAFSNQTLRLDVESTVNPRAAAAMIGPGPVKFLEPFRLNGPVKARVRGLLDYCNFSLNQLDVHVDARNFGHSRWEADTAVFDFSVRGRRLAFSNVTATGYGGRVEGSGRLYPVGNDSTWRYETDFQAAEIQLAEILEASIGKPVENLRGAVDGTGRIGGFIGAGTGPTVTGEGRATVRDGLLFQTRLFRGLSAVLAKIMPDFSLFAQTDAGGTYTIRGSKVHSRDIQLQGSVFSVKAAGSYAFDGTLDYSVEVQLLRGGPVAMLVRLATMPLTRLLKFKLTGTFADPTWRPENLNPASLF